MESRKRTINPLSINLNWWIYCACVGVYLAERWGSQFLRTSHAWSTVDRECCASYKHIFAQSAQCSAERHLVRHEVRHNNVQ